MCRRAMVTAVTRGSAAEKAGLQRGDVILAVNGKLVVSTAQLRTRVGLTRAGETVELEILRNGDRIKASAVVMPSTP